MSTRESSDSAWNRIPETDVNDLSAFIRGRSISRRTVAKGAMVAAGGAALGVVGGAFSRFPRTANAVVGNEYDANHCGNYGSWEGYDDKSTQTPCVGGTYGSQYCGSDGWFLQQTSGSWSSTPVKACGDNTTKRNAWRWNSGGSAYRCADGVQGYSGQYLAFRICQRTNP